MREMTAMTEPQPPRRKRGFEPAAGLLRERIKAVGEVRGFAVSRLLTHWAEVVGDEIAAVSRPVKVGYGRGAMGATLTLLTTGAAGPILQMHLPRLRERVNACYGYNAIAHVKITQTAPMGFAEGQAEFGPALRPAPKAADPAIKRAAAEAVRGIGDDTLRAALEALGENVLSRPKSKSVEAQKG